MAVHGWIYGETKGWPSKWTAGIWTSHTRVGSVKNQQAGRDRNHFGTHRLPIKLKNLTLQPHLPPPVKFHSIREHKVHLGKTKRHAAKRDIPAQTVREDNNVCYSYRSFSDDWRPCACSGQQHWRGERQNEQTPAENKIGIEKEKHKQPLQC